MDSDQTDRRAFLRTVAAMGSAVWLTPRPSLCAADDAAVELPLIQKPSTDATLPGTWHILDRTKPVRKLIDRKSLLPIGPRSLVMIDIRMQVTFAFPAKRSHAVLALPADVGDEQTLLGCHVSVRTEKGKDVESEAKLHQAKGAGVRVVQIAFGPTPDDNPATISVKCVLLQPPVQAAAEQPKLTEAIRKRPGTKAKDWSANPGFPEPLFKDGGPTFVNVKPSASCFQTIYDVLRAADGLVMQSLDPQFVTDDPDRAKANKKGPNSARVRVAEKGLYGVARAFYVGAFSQDSLLRRGTTLYSLLLIEDPETGAYFIGEVTSPNPRFGPHPGNIFITGGLKNDGVPNPYNLPLKEVLPQINIGRLISGDPVKAFKPLALHGTSTAGNNDSAQYRAWLAKLPDEFRDIEKKLKG
jgi:hypothetical protein